MLLTYRPSDCRCETSRSQLQNRVAALGLLRARLWALEMARVGGWVRPALRSDVHRLFDAGYVTVTPDYRFRGSSRIKYYAMDDRPLWLPANPALQPNKEFLSWHSEARFIG